MALNVTKWLRSVLPAPAEALERRLHKRAVQYWQSRQKRGELVRVSDFDPLAIEDQSSHGFLLSLESEDAPVFTYVGPVLEEEAGVKGDSIRFAEVREDSLLMRFASHYRRVLSSRSPETAEYDFVTDAGYHVLCRGALLPLSSAGTEVDHVYGVISWKSEKLASV